MSDIQLRPYQRKFIDDIRAEFQSGQRRVVGVAPCGAGKTIMTGWMIRESLNRGKRSIFFVHRKELIDQTSATFTALNIPHGIISAGEKMNLNEPVQIASVQTLARRLDDVPAPDFLICDECHHILAENYKKIIDKYPAAFLLGVTATPQRMGGVTLHDAFDSLVNSISVNQLIEIGNLATFNYFALQESIDLSKVGVDKFGEFNQNQLADVMKNTEITGDIIAEYKKLAPGKAAICYCVDIAHSKSVADAFRRAGINAVHVDGNTPKDERNFIVDEFRRGNINVLCNVELFGEGFDVPHCQAVILARPTRSLTLYIQQAMRPLRPDPDDTAKVAVIIDHVQNYLRHGLPNVDRHWSLLKNDFEEILCPHCRQYVIPEIRDGLKYCPKCHALLTRERKYKPRNKSLVDGKIAQIEVDFSAEQNTAEILHAAEPTTPEEFLAIAKERNRKKSWVVHQSMKFAKSYEDCLHIARVVGYKDSWATFTALDIAKSYNDCLAIARAAGYKDGWAWHKWQEIKPPAQS